MPYISNCEGYLQYHFWKIGDGFLLGLPYTFMSIHRPYPIVPIVPIHIR